MMQRSFEQFHTDSSFGSSEMSFDERVEKISTARQTLKENEKLLNELDEHSAQEQDKIMNQIAHNSEFIEESEKLIRELVLGYTSWAFVACLKYYSKGINMAALMKSIDWKLTKLFQEYDYSDTASLDDEVKYCIKLEVKKYLDKAKQKDKAKQNGGRKCL